MGEWSRPHNGSRDRSNPRSNKQRLTPTRLPAERRDTPKPPEQLEALHSSFQPQQPSFCLQSRSAAVAAQTAVAGNYPVAKNHDRYRIARQRSADWAARARSTQLFRNPMISPNLARRDTAGHVENAPLKRGQLLDIAKQLETRPVSGRGLGQ